MLSIVTLLLIASFPPVTRWVSPDDSRPTPKHEWQQTLLNLPAWQSERITTLTGGNDRVNIIVESSLIEPLQEQLDSMLIGLNREGRTTSLISARGTSPESLRTFLQAELDSGLTSAVLIGNLPIAWFQMINDFNSSGSNDGYEEFPCDLYFMDLTGTWLDTLVRYEQEDSLIPGSDGIFDIHFGTIEPDIGISRLYVHNITGGDSLLRPYLERSHDWRTGRSTTSGRGLTYIDDDWIPWAGFWDRDHSLAYSERLFIWDAETTRAADYRDRIRTDPYESILLCAHSWPGGHAFTYNQGNNHDWYYAYSIPEDNPEARFWNLFACSNARFIEYNYCAGRYAFSTDHGLSAIGSTKTGSMLEFQDWYQPLADGASLNEAFRDWFAAQAVGGFNPGERSWFYGMTLLGDGTLRPRRTQTPVAETPYEMRPTGPTGRTILTIAETHRLADTQIYDALGRKVNPAQLVPGVYYLRSEDSAAPSLRRIIIIR